MLLFVWYVRLNGSDAFSPLSWQNGFIYLDSYQDVINA